MGGPVRHSLHSWTVTHIHPAQGQDDTPAVWTCTSTPRLPGDAVGWAPQVQAHLGPEACLCPAWSPESLRLLGSGSPGAGNLTLSPFPGQRGQLARHADGVSFVQTQ